MAHWEVKLESFETFGHRVQFTARTGGEGVALRVSIAMRLQTTKNMECLVLIMFSIFL